MAGASDAFTAPLCNSMVVAREPDLYSTSQRPAIGIADFPSRERIDAGLRHSGSDQSLSRLVLHARRLSGTDPHETIRRCVPCARGRGTSGFPVRLSDRISVHPASL